MMQKYGAADDGFMRELDALSVDEIRISVSRTALARVLAATLPHRSRPSRRSLSMPTYDGSASRNLPLATPMATGVSLWRNWLG